jgi:hypothetical protein
LCLQRCNSRFVGRDLFASADQFSDILVKPKQLSASGLDIAPECVEVEE